MAAPCKGPSVTVVIPTRDRSHLISDAIESLLQLDYPSVEVLVVDQSSDDSTRRIVQQFARRHPNVRYCATDTVGSSANRNIGAILSRTEFVAYTDDDCIVDPRWLGSLMAELNQHGIAAVYGRVLPYSSKSRTGVEFAVRDGRKRIEYSGKAPPWHVGTGGSMAFRRADLLSIGGFDPLLGAGCELRSSEDADVSYRLLAAGKRIVFTPEAVTYHKLWKDWRSQQRMERAYGIGAGAQFAKYVRCGDSYGILLLCMWIWQLGVRRFAAGILKWHNWKVMYVAYCQLVYPWLGVCRSLRHPVDRRLMTYVARPWREEAGPSRSNPLHRADPNGHLRGLIEAEPTRDSG